MKITDIINGSSPSLSFEVFPPKTNDKYENVSRAIYEIAQLSPSYMSVTYGAGGGTSEYTAKISNEVLKQGVTPLAHLSCISSSKAQVKSQVQQLQNLGIKNILALRGDIPSGLDRFSLDFNYAYELIDEIKSIGDFCIGGACYPEGHPESTSLDRDIDYLKIKIDHGCDFLTTQMFFDNNVFYRFIDKLMKKNIDVPIVAGIMPITSFNQLDNMAVISGNQLPKSFLDIITKYNNDPISLKKAGIEFAIMQARQIYESGFNSVHIYTMNKFDVAKEIKMNLADITKC